MGPVIHSAEPAVTSPHPRPNRSHRHDASGPPPVQEIPRDLRQPQNRDLVAEPNNPCFKPPLGELQHRREDRHHERRPNRDTPLEKPSEELSGAIKKELEYGRLPRKLHRKGTAFKSLTKALDKAIIDHYKDLLIGAGGRPVNTEVHRLRKVAAFYVNIRQGNLVPVTKFYD